MALFVRVICLGMKANQLRERTAKLLSPRPSSHVTVRLGCTLSHIINMNWCWGGYHGGENIVYMPNLQCVVPDGQAGSRPRDGQIVRSPAAFAAARFRAAKATSSSSTSCCGRADVFSAGATERRRLSCAAVVAQRPVLGAQRASLWRSAAEADEVIHHCVLDRMALNFWMRVSESSYIICKLLKSHLSMMHTVGIVVRHF
jgi:hypothetical protein